MYKKVIFKSALRFSSPTTAFILCSDSCTHFSKSRGRDSRNPVSGYLLTMWIINCGCIFLSLLPGEPTIPRIPFTTVSSHPPTPVKPLFLWSTLHCPIVIFTFIRMGAIGRSRKNAYVSFNTAFLLLLSANSVNPFSSTALNKPSESPLLLLPIKAKEIR